MASFNLWERDITINVKNFTLEKPEDTVFKVIDYKWEEFYRWSYYLNDIKKQEQPLTLSFNTMHCDYNLKYKINPNNYQKNINIEYKYNTRFECKIDISPVEAKQYIEVSQKSIKPAHEISLNDLFLFNYFWIFVVGLFLCIAFNIHRINKNKELINTKTK